MGVVVYGYRPKIWFLLNRHGRSDTLLQEIQSTPFDESPGNNIGQFLLTDTCHFFNLVLGKCMLGVVTLSVSLCRWGSEIHQAVSSDPLSGTETEGPWCCRHHCWQKISWQPDFGSQQPQGFRCAGADKQAVTMQSPVGWHLGFEL